MDCPTLAAQTMRNKAKLIVVHAVLNRCKTEAANQDSDEDEMRSYLLQNMSLDGRMNDYTGNNNLLHLIQNKLYTKINLPFQQWLIASSCTTAMAHYVSIFKQLRKTYVGKYLHHRRLATEFDLKLELSQSNNTILNIFERLNRNGYIRIELPGTDKCIVVESHEQVRERMTYLKDILRYRKDNRNIIYLEERSILGASTFLEPYDSRPDTRFHYISLVFTQDNQIQTEHVVIDRLNQQFQNLKCSKLLIKFIEVAMSKISEKSVVVLGDKGYHKRVSPAVPTIHSTRHEMVSWLQHHEIPHDPETHRAELYRLIEYNKRFDKKDCEIDLMLRQEGHDVLRRPFHCQMLNVYSSFWEDVGSNIVNLMRKAHHTSTTETKDRFVVESLEDVTKKYTPDVWREKEEILKEEEKKIYKEDIQMEKVMDSLMTTAKYGGLDIKDLEHLNSFCHIDYCFSNIVKI